MKNYVLHDDVIAASELFLYCYDCLREAGLAIQFDQLEKADAWIVEYERARDELLVLRQKKVENDSISKAFS
ncbi:hypothetical protein ACJ2A9_23355 [Anaerobacillus sp. MEB173]|uniref:hypothetical protein n=1 Tax=Anaerobacillus sp. MEB173 TaxID=3383345 RepID=UPI003F900DD7